MRQLVDTILEDPGWETLGLDALAERAGRAVLMHLDLDPACYEISLLGCDDARIAGLNTEFRGKPKPTNVLSWPSDERGAETPGDPPLRPDVASFEMPAELGDIAIARETCLREADAAKISAEAHLTHLLIHGVLHLLGYDHETDEDAALMEGLETEILAGLGFANPYA